MNKIIKYALIAIGFFAIAVGFIFFKDEEKKRTVKQPDASGVDEKLLEDTANADLLRAAYDEETEEDKPRALRLYKKMLAPDLFALAFGDIEIPA